MVGFSSEKNIHNEIFELFTINKSDRNKMQFFKNCNLNFTVYGDSKLPALARMCIHNSFTT